MNNTAKLQAQQEAIRFDDTNENFFSDFQLGRLMNESGIRKLRGASPVKVFAAIFKLPFEGNN